MTVNDTTNSLTTRIIFGGNKRPQDQFNYRNMGDTTQIYDPNRDLPFTMGEPEFDEFTAFDKKGRPIFPGYKFEGGKSLYRGEEVGEGGYVYAEPGMYGDIALLDIASMHPSSIIAEELFGPEYTKRFQEIKDARVEIKHKNFEKARKMLNGALAKYLTDEGSADALAQALKIAINSVYGLTSANFENPFRDNRNKDNIVAKRGALFMVNLKHEVQKRGFTVAHIKTDSIKIPDATPAIIDFVMKYGEKYGYTFEHEATYDRMCLVIFGNTPANGTPPAPSSRSPTCSRSCSPGKRSCSRICARPSRSPPRCTWIRTRPCRMYPSMRKSLKHCGKNGRTKRDSTPWIMTRSLRI